MWENLGLSEKVILGSIGLEFGSVLYIQDKGNKEVNKVYIDKNSGIMYKCIKATSNQSNTEEYFSRVDIGNIYDTFKTYSYYINENSELGDKYKHIVTCHIGSKQYNPILHYVNGIILISGNSAIMEIGLGINFENVPVADRPMFPIDEWTQFIVDYHTLFDLFKFDKTQMITSGRGQANMVTISLNSLTASDTIDIPGRAMSMVMNQYTLTIDTGDLGDTNVQNYRYLRRCELIFTKVFSVK